MESITEHKKIIRDNIKKIREGMNQEDISMQSKAIIERLLELDVYKNSKSIMSYISIGNEVNTRDFLRDELDKKQKTILVPYMQNHKIVISELHNIDELVSEEFGTLCPKTKIQYNDKIDLIIVPGIAFDESGSRIGFGKGYYDSFLENRKNSVKIALCFEGQIVEKILNEDHDIPVDMIITENRIIKANR